MRQWALRGLALASQSYEVYDRATLVLAPHPDDEIFGLGGLIALNKKRGDRVRVVFLTNGEGSHRSCCDIPGEEITRQRRRLALEAGRIVGLDSAEQIFLGWPDGAIPHPGQAGFADAVAALRQQLADWGPCEVFCPHPFEGWSDHIATEEIAREALSGVPAGCALYHYCVWFWMSMPFFRRGLRCHWSNARVLDISAVQPIKQRSITAYMDARASCGKPYSGVLPPEFLRAHAWSKELFFRAM